jgi:hypothetical protein
VHHAREHNLKNIDVEIPRDQLTVITSLSRPSVFEAEALRVGSRAAVRGIEASTERMPMKPTPINAMPKRISSFCSTDWA